VELAALQRLMESTYGARDRDRGVAASVAWLCEEVGEFAKAARKGSREEQLEELADVLAWLASIANQLGLSMDDAVERYAAGCPKCSGVPCTCPS
jgi:NTP pyrophosphatase (non-canonical NTP hydrolase)